MTSELDCFSNPLDPSREFVVDPNPKKELSDFDGFEHVVVLSGSGATKVDRATAQADFLKRKPRLMSKALGEIIHTANVAWVLDEGAEKDNDEFDEDGVKKGSHFEGDF